MKVCTTAFAVTKQGSGFSIATNCVEIRLLFLTDSGPVLTEILQKNPTVSL